MACSKIDGLLAKAKAFKVTSGAVEETCAFEWKIENFLVIKSSKEFINEQKFNFDAGASHGTPTKWCCHFTENPETKNIGIYLTLTHAPPKFRTSVNYSFRIIKPNGAIRKTGSATATVFTLEAPSWGFREMISVIDENTKELIWEDGSIVIKVDFKLFLLKLVTDVQPKKLDVQEEVDRLEKGELQKLRVFMTQMIKHESQPDLGKVIKVVSKDGIEFYASTAILASRSPVFKAMFKSGNWKEAQGSCGVYGGGESSLVLEDLSGKTVNVLLHFLIGGGLLKEDWMAEGVILELTYAADKYQLEALTQFLDKVLPEFTYSTELMAKLALLAKRLGMKNAEKRLFAKVKESATDIEQMVLDKEGCLLGKG